MAAGKPDLLKVEDYPIGAFKEDNTYALSLLN